MAVYIPRKASPRSEDDLIQASSLMKFPQFLIRSALTFDTPQADLIQDGCSVDQWELSRVLICVSAAFCTSVMNSLTSVR